MRAALLISGYLRSMKLNVSSIKKFIIEKFDTVDVYIHITENENYDDKYLNHTDQVEMLKFIQESFNVKSLLIEKNYHFNENKVENNLYNNWYKYYKLNQLKILNESIGDKYDVVIKIRPDVNISNLNFDFGLERIHIPKNSLIDKSKLRDISDPYICDIIAYGSSDNMNMYFNIYTQLGQLVSKYGTVSETILYQYLNQGNDRAYSLDDIEYNVILSQCNVFAVCGDSGSGKSTLGSLLKQYFSNSVLLECDRYHKWERNDNKWREYTHLNPEANYISKMNEDIFNLKIKNDVYQVDYDHTTGKFIEPQKLETSDNVIVCGLHSLYNDNNHVYDLKIFMDTDEDLKRQWKIDRDVSKRGYSIDKVLEQLERRKDDYKKYIEPQKENSDVIVNFFANPDVCLRVSIDNTHSIEHILSMFSKHSIPFTLKNTKRFNVLTFTEARTSELWKFKLDSGYQFYNYIMYIITNLK